MNFFTSLFDKFVSYKLPLPQGPFPVGTTDQHWIHEAIRVDHEKISSEFFNANCEQTAAAPTTSTNQAATFAREFEDDLHPIIQVHKEKLRTHQTMGLNVKLWFPIDDATAKASTRKTAPYLKDHFIPYMKRLNMDALPESLVKYYMSVGCNAIEANAIRQGTFPVLIFCHGMYAVPEFYTAYCENIASFGFIVVAPYHTDGSSLHVRYNFSSETLHVIEFERHPLRDYSNQFLKQEEFYLRRRQLFQRVHNVQYILEFLELVRFAQLESHILAGHLHKDSPKVSICGHSFGACTALASCLKEPTRITAGIGLDGWYFGLSNCKEQLKVPFFCINSEMWQWDSNLEIMHDILKNAANPSHTFLHTIKNSRHHDFSDIAAIMPHVGRLVKSLGPTPLKTLDDVNRMILEFIRCYSLDFTTFEKLKTYTYEKVAVPPPVPTTSNNEILTTVASEPITNTTTTTTAS